MVTLYLANGSYFKYTISGYQANETFRSQRSEKQKGLPGAIKGLGCGQFSLVKHCQAETLPMETGSRGVGLNK